MNMRSQASQDMLFGFLAVAPLQPRLSRFEINCRVKRQEFSPCPARQRLRPVCEFGRKAQNPALYKLNTCTWSADEHAADGAQHAAYSSHRLQSQARPMGTKEHSIGC